MARTISWFPRLQEIRAAVEKSPLSLWERRDLENLFELQPSAASKALATIPRGRGPGGALLVERDAILRFLNEVERTARLPMKRTKVSRKKMRLTVLPAREVGKGSVAAIPETVTLEPGKLAVVFRNGEDLISQMWALALAARDDEAAFLKLVTEQVEKKPLRNEHEELEKDLKEREAAFARRKKAS